MILPNDSYTKNRYHNIIHLFHNSNSKLMMYFCCIVFLKERYCFHEHFPTLFFKESPSCKFLKSCVESQEILINLDEHSNKSTNIHWEMFSFEDAYLIFKLKMVYTLRSRNKKKKIKNSSRIHKYYMTMRHWHIIYDKCVFSRDWRVYLSYIKADILDGYYIYPKHFSIS